MLQSTVEPRPSTCNTCGFGPVHPRLIKESRGSNIVTEAHWICPRCSSRFMVGVVSIEPREKKQN
jgi:DNA-directed RNA polymerase subunit RPC12/RpoP